MSNAKQRVKALIPGPVLSPLRQFLGRFNSEIQRNRARSGQLKQAHEEAQKGSSAGTMVFRSDLQFNLHPASVESFEWFCFRSPEMVEEMNCFLRLADGKQRLLDVGALHGVFSLAFAIANSHRQVVAVDASPLAFAMLLYNVHKNPAAAISPVEMALSDSNGSIEMHFEEQHAVAAGSSSSPNRFMIPAITGDELCAARSFEPDIVKIDVEGHECKVLRGLRKTISKLRPDLFLEVHPQRIREEGESLEFLSEYFSSLGYSAHSIFGTSFDLARFGGLQSDARLFLSASDAHS
jgi:FkbM family methyltransferase